MRAVGRPIGVADRCREAEALRDDAPRVGVSRGARALAPPTTPSALPTSPQRLTAQAALEQLAGGVASSAMASSEDDDAEEAVEGLSRQRQRGVLAPA